MKDELYNIMIVDDEKILVDEIVDYLSDIKHLNLKAYTNPVEAMNDFKRFRPHIIISDLMMPQMNGLDLLKSVKAKNQDVEFIIITGYGDMDSTIKALQNRASNFLLKPARMELLEEYILRSIEHIKKEKQKRVNQMIMRHTDKMIWLGMLGSKVVHDSRNSITYIRGNIQNLKSYYTYLSSAIDYYLKNSGSNEIKPKLEFIKNDFNKILECMLEGADKLGKISENIFQLSNTCELEKTDFNKIEMREVIYNTLDVMNYFNNNSIVINYLKNEGKDVYIDGNKNAMELSILNVLLNAHYSCENISDGVIGIRTHLQNSSYYVEITHNGEAIPTENINEIFDPFFSNKTRNKQFWIGLGISKKIIEKHNGKFSAVSESISDRIITKFIIELKTVN